MAVSSWNAREMYRDYNRDSFLEVTLVSREEVTQKLLQGVFN